MNQWVGVLDPAACVGGPMGPVGMLIVVAVAGFWMMGVKI